MWFKQVQFWSISSHIDTNPNVLIEQLQALAFRPCLPSLPLSSGWVSPIEDDLEEMPLVLGINGCLMLCLQIEEKVLPSHVIAHELKMKVREVEANEARRLRHKEKMAYKDEIIHTLLSRAFSKYTRIYGYIDTRHNWLVINTTSPKKVELFISQLKKSLGDQIEAIEVVKPSSIMTHWLNNQSNPTEFGIEKFCLLQDPNQENRTIRCQQQNLFAEGIKSLMKDGCEVVQLSVSWYDKLQFILTKDFFVRSIQRIKDDMIEVNDDEFETKLQKFSADFLIMSELLAGLLGDLMGVFAKK